MDIVVTRAREFTGVEGTKETYKRLEEWGIVRLKRDNMFAVVCI